MFRSIHVDNKWQTLDDEFKNNVEHLLFINIESFDWQKKKIFVFLYLEIREFHYSYNVKNKHASAIKPQRNSIQTSEIRATFAVI